MFRVLDVCSDLYALSCCMVIAGRASHLQASRFSQKTLQLGDRLLPGRRIKPALSAVPGVGMRAVLLHALA
jgi:hypothetical protein